MKTAEDFRKIARTALTNKWSIAVLVGVVASLLGAPANEGPQFKFNMDVSDVESLIPGSLGFVLVAAIVMAAAYFVIGSFISIGYAKFNLNLVDDKSAEIKTLFEYFSYWKTTSILSLIRTLYVFLWMLLFIIPGIIAGFSYAMTDYIIAENPDLTASEAIQRSKSIMVGNRWRFFWLQFSFIGWDILATLTLGIGYLWLIPYKNAAYAAFYREVS